MVCVCALNKGWKINWTQKVVRVPGFLRKKMNAEKVDQDRPDIRGSRNYKADWKTTSEEFNAALYS